MSVELASAWVNLTVSAKGIKGDLDRELGRPAEEAANKAGIGASKSFSDSFSSVGGSLTKVGTASVAAAGLVGTALFKAAGSFGELALSAGKMADTTGLAVDDASRWTEVAADMGIEAGTLEASLNKMNVTAGKSPETFDKFDVAIAKTKTGTTDVDGTFKNVIDRLNAIKDPAEKAEAATALLGKGWTGMSELIATGSDSLTTSLAAVSESKVINPDELQKAKDMRAGLDSLKDAGEDLALSIGQSVTPMVTGIASALGGAAQRVADFDVASGGMVGTVLGVGTAVLAAAGSISFIAGQALKMKGRFTDATGGLNNFGKAAGAAGVALGALGIAVGVVEAMDALAGRTGDVSEEMNAFLTVLGKAGDNKTGVEDIFNSFTDLGASIQDTTGYIESFGDMVTDGGSQSELQLLQLQKAFDQVLAQSPELAAKVVNALKQVQTAADNGQKSAQDNLKYWGVSKGVIDQWSTTALNAVDAQNTLAGSTAADTEAVKQLRSGVDSATQVYGPFVTEVDEAAAATLRAEKAQLAAAKSADELAAATGRSEAKLRDYEAAWDSMTGNLDSEQAMINLKTQIIDVKVAGEEALAAQILANEAIAAGADDALAKQVIADNAQRSYQSTLLGTKQSVIDIGKEMGLLPSEVQTLLNLVDNNQIATMEARLVTLARNRTMQLSLDLKGATGTFLVNAGPREHGGPVIAGQPYVVGEKRPELFVPNVDGYIMPTVPTASQSLLTLAPNAASAATAGITVINNRRDIGVSDLNQILAMARLAS